MFGFHMFHDRDLEYHDPLENYEDPFACDNVGGYGSWLEYTKELDRIHDEMKRLSSCELVSIARKSFAEMSDEQLYDLLTQIHREGAMSSCIGPKGEVVCIMLMKLYGGPANVLEIIRPGKEYLAANERVVARNASLTEYYVRDAVFAGGWIDSADHPIVRCCYSKRTQYELSVQLQAKYHDSLKCVHVTLRQIGNDIAARADWAAYTTPDRNVGYDFSSGYSIDHDSRVSIAMTDNHEVCATCRLFVSKIPTAQDRDFHMPVLVYQNGLSGPWTPSGLMGNVSALKIEDDYEDKTSQNSCMKVSYSSSSEWGGLYWQNPQDDWGEDPGGQNLVGANALVFRARGEMGGERVSFFIGHLMNKMISDTAERILADVVLTNKWKLYSIDLTGLDLSRIKSGFGFWFQGQNRPITFYLNGIFYNNFDERCLRKIARLGNH